MIYSYLRTPVNLFFHANYYRNLSYKGKKIFNNAGVNQFRLYLSKLEEDGIRPSFFYPVTLDVRAEVSATTRGDKSHGGTANAGVRYQKATGYFNNATRAAPSYAPAYLNLACLQSARAEVKTANAQNLLRQAKTNAQKALRLAKNLLSQDSAYKTLVTNARVVLAIVSFQENKKANLKKAKAMLEPLLTDKKDFVALNLRVIGKRAPGEIPNQEKLDANASSEQIAGITLNNPTQRGNYLNNTDKKYVDGTAKASLKVEVDKDLGIRIYLEKMPARKAQKIVLLQQGRLVYFLKTLPGYRGAAALSKPNLSPIRLGDGYKKITALYGFPQQQRSSTLASVGHTFKVYRGRKIIFKLSQDFKLASWLIYWVVNPK